MEKEFRSMCEKNATNVAKDDSQLRWCAEYMTKINLCLFFLHRSIRYSYMEKKKLTPFASYAVSKYSRVHTFPHNQFLFNISLHCCYCLCCREWWIGRMKRMAEVRERIHIPICSKVNELRVIVCLINLLCIRIFFLRHVCHGLPFTTTELNDIVKQKIAFR